jgi:hypothetical protein
MLKNIGLGQVDSLFCLAQITRLIALFGSNFFRGRGNHSTEMRFAGTSANRVHKSVSLFLVRANQTIRRYLFGDKVFRDCRRLCAIVRYAISMKSLGS